MTTNVTSPALYALGTVTTLVSFTAIALALGSIAIIQAGAGRAAACRQKTLRRRASTQ